MTEREKKAAGADPVGEIGARFLRALGETFPICAASDEFYFFPQVALPDRDWAVWDDFSKEGAGRFADRLSSWERELQSAAAAASAFDAAVDGEALLGSMKTLREQLVLIGHHRMQPSFHLTVVSIGLSQALESRDREHWRRRIGGLPAFLERAAACLENPPALFLEIGVEMAGTVRGWVESLDNEGWPVAGLPGALGRFEDFLRGLRGKDAFFLPGDLLELIVGDHMGGGIGTAALWRCLSEEQEQMEEILREEADRLAPGLPWLEASRRVPRIEAPAGKVVELYRREVRRLEGHCRTLGLDGHLGGRGSPLEVRVVPACLAGVRASESYNAVPGHPSRGGTFFVFERGGGGGGGGLSTEYRMTTAHETWPGHHLLDISRWSLARPLRRSLEYPLFYEGWACFAEEMTARTGYFTDPWDRFILARRRLRRAVRGVVDLGLQSGRLTLAAAAGELERIGFQREQARSAVPKYALRPGYQVCYTSGLVRFLDLWSRFGGEDYPSFARTVLEEGEIGFGNLEKLFRKRRDR